MSFENFFSRMIPGVLLAVMSLLVTGCSDKIAVSGSVTYSDNGEPVKFGVVVFNGDKDQGRGTIKDGKYSAGLLKDGEGLPPGSYTVSAENASSPMGAAMSRAVVDMDGNRSAVETEAVESYYTKAPQTIEVKKAMTYDFTVERGPRK